MLYALMVSSMSTTCMVKETSLTCQLCGSPPAHGHAWDRMSLSNLDAKQFGCNHSYMIDMFDVFFDMFFDMLLLVAVCCLLSVACC